MESVPFPSTSQTDIDILLRQGELSFRPGLKLQTRWGAMEAGMFTLECAGAGLAVAALLASMRLGREFPDLSMGVALGVLLVVLAMALVLTHLGHPERSWRTMRNWRTSWLSRGSIVVSAFVVLGLVQLALPALGMPAAAMPIAWLLMAAGLFVTLYPGLVMSASPAIAFWSSGLLPVVSACNALASGTTLLIVVAAFETERFPVRQVSMVAFWMIVALALLLLIYVSVMQRRGGTARASASYLVRREAWLFIGAAWGLGLAFPAVLLVVAAGGDALLFAPLFILAAAAARLAGDFALRLAMLRCGMFSPLV